MIEETIFDKDITKMSKEELKQLVMDLRAARKRGYEIKPRTRKASNPFADVPSEIAEKILAELQEKGK